MVKEEDKPKEKVEDKKPTESEDKFDVSSLVDGISKEIQAEEKKKEQEIKDTTYSKDQVKEMMKEMLKKNIETDKKLKEDKEAATKTLDELKAEQATKMQELQKQMEALDNANVGSKSQTPAEKDPFSMPNKDTKIGINEKLGEHKAREDGFSNATDEYSKRNLIKWGVLRRSSTQ